MPATLSNPFAPTPPTAERNERRHRSSRHAQDNSPPFALLPEEDVFHQGRGVYVHRGRGGAELPLYQLQRSTLFISRMRIVLVFESRGGATELEEAAPRRVWSMPLEHVDGEELVTSGPRPYLRFESSAPYSEGVFEVHCAIPDQQQATQAMIRTFIVLLGRLFESRFPATLEPVEGACEGAGAETCSLAPALALAPGAGALLGDDPASPLGAKQEPRSGSPAARRPPLSLTLPPIAGAVPRERAPGSPGPAAGPLVPHAPAHGAGEAMYCLRVPYVDTATGEVQVAVRTFERRRAAFLDRATGQLYLAEEQRPQPPRPAHPAPTPRPAPGRPPSAPPSAASPRRDRIDGHRRCVTGKVHARSGISAAPGARLRITAQEYRTFGRSKASVLPAVGENTHFDWFRGRLQLPCASRRLFGSRSRCCVARLA
eukprot:tig00021612_g22861.t1